MSVALDCDRGFDVIDVEVLTSCVFSGQQMLQAVER